MNTNLQQDVAVRQAAFNWLESQVRLYGDVLPRTLLIQGFDFQGKRVPLLSPQGIFKPAILDLPLTITTIPDGPYDDGYLSDTLMQYRYRGSDPQHRDNKGLREAMRLHVPLIYFYQVVIGRYLTLWPVYIVGDNPDKLTFTVQMDDASTTLFSGDEARSIDMINEEPRELRRAYITASVRQRVHQRAFRERVLQAYREQCAICRLRHTELLDAAHIIPDGEPGGEPIVQNGLSLCKIHHAAYDRNFIGVRPDYVVEVRQDILNENDGPMLLHGLKEMNGVRIKIPNSLSNRPNKQLLERRYERFLGG